jgi:hypothetical protein
LADDVTPKEAHLADEPPHHADHGWERTLYGDDCHAAQATDTGRDADVARK